MDIVYRLILLYFGALIVLGVFGQKRLRDRIGPIVVLVLFALRLFLIK